MGGQVLPSPHCVEYEGKIIHSFHVPYINADEVLLLLNLKKKLS